MITVREVSASDLDSLSDFLSAQPPFSHTTKDTWMRRFHTWWVSNPVNNARYPMGWVLVDKEKILGFLGNIPLKFLMYGKEKIAAAAVAWYVDPTVRGIYSLRLFDEFLQQPGVSIFLFNSDSKALIRLISRYGFKEYVLPKFQNNYYLVLQRRRFLFLLKELGAIKNIRDALFLRGSGSLIWKIFRGLVFQDDIQFLRAFHTEEYSSSLCSSCDESFSKIWESSNDQCDVMMMRTIETLHWIYFSSISPSERIVLQCRRIRDDSLVGYMVFDIKRQKPSDTAVMKLMDVCLERFNSGVVTSLLQCAISTAIQNRIPLLEFWAWDEKSEEFFRDRFSIRKKAQHHNLIRLSDTVQQQTPPPVICTSIIDPPRGIDHF